jgi:ABC-type Fe3+ transport system substrate-binding protein
MVIAKGLRHPYAAALLADFILSTEGQEILAKAEYFPARADVPPLPGLNPVIPRDAGVPEDFLSPQKFLQYTDSSEKIFQEIFR